MKISNDHITLTSVQTMQNYNRWLVNLFEAYFGTDILEIGSGIGTLSQLLPKTSNKTLTDINPAYIKQLKRLKLGNVIHCDIQKPPLSLKKAGFDTIFSSNVFEHIENDDLVFKNAYYFLKPGGYLLLFVPAKQSIYGEIDKELFHFRRYEKTDLQKKLLNTGFEITKIRYYNFIGFFTWWFSGQILKSKNISPKMSKIFDTLIVPFLKLEEFIDLPFGQNLLVIAQKPK